MKDNKILEIHLEYLSRVATENKLYRKAIAILFALFAFGMGVTICGYVFLIRSIPIFIVSTTIIGAVGAWIWNRLHNCHENIMTELKAEYDKEMFSQLGTVHRDEKSSSKL